MSKKVKKHKKAEICLEPDGFSIHTFELSMQLSKSEWHNCKEQLYAEQKKSSENFIYADKSCKGLYTCTKYADAGIRIRLEHIGSKKENLKYFVRMIVNPRKLVYPQSGYLGILPPEESSIELLEKIFQHQFRKSPFEKELRKYKINFCRTRITAKKYYNKYYGAGNAFETPDDTALNELYNKEARYDEKEDILYKKLFEAEENKDKHEIANIKRQIKELKEKFKKLNKQINEEQNRRLSYTRSAKPLLDANKILRQAENYTHFEEIKERYEEAKRNLDLAEAEVEAEAEA